MESITGQIRDMMIEEYSERLTIEVYRIRFMTQYNKEKRTINKAYKEEIRKEKNSIFKYVHRIEDDIQYIITQKNGLLIDSFFAIIKEVKDTMIETDNIFQEPKVIIINKFMAKRFEILENHFFITRFHNITEHDCLICLEKINKFSIVKCGRCVAKFHNYCINKWAEKSEVCPMCKFLLFTNFVY